MTRERKSSRQEVGSAVVGVVSYGAGAAVIAWPAIAAQLALTSEQLGTVAVVVLVAQIGVGLGRIAFVLASETADVSTMPRLAQLVVGMAITLAVGAMLSPDWEAALLGLLAIPVALVELCRLSLLTGRASLMLAVVWLVVSTLLTVVLELVDILDPFTLSSAWVAGAVVSGAAVIGRDEWANLRDELRDRVGMQWHAFWVGASDFATGAGGVVVLVFALQRTGGLTDVGLWRTGSNLALPASLAAAAASFVSSSPRFVTKRATASIMGVATGMAGCAASAVLCVVVTEIGWFTPGERDVGLAVIAAVAASALTIPGLVYLRRQRRSGVIVVCRSLGIVLQVVLILMFADVMSVVDAVIYQAIGAAVGAALMVFFLRQRAGSATPASTT